LLYSVTFVAPLAMIAVLSVSRFEGGVTSFAPTLDNYRLALQDGVTVAVLWRTARLAGFVTLVSAILAFPVALVMRRVGGAARMIILALVVAPLLTSVIVRNVAWLLVLGRNGFINDMLSKLGFISSPLPLMYNDFGVAVATLHVYLAFAVLPIYASVLSIDTRIEESAASLGASPPNVFWRVTFPLALPGVVAGCTLVFVLSMGLYLTPAIMGGSFVVTIAMLITDLARNQYNWPMASALAVLLLASIAVVLLVSSWFHARKRLV
jgi:putative spermidine/putrescine transport system permease protein